jgi:hypothetical protein
MSTDNSETTTKSGERMDRLQKSVYELQKAIDDFPKNAEELLALSSAHNDDVLAEDDNEEEDASDGGRKVLDIRDKLQRIKARYKVVMAKLGIPHHSLKTVLQNRQRGEQEPSKPPSAPMAEEPVYTSTTTTRKVSPIKNNNDTLIPPALSSDEW